MNINTDCRYKQEGFGDISLGNENLIMWVIIIQRLLYTCVSLQDFTHKSETFLGVVLFFNVLFMTGALDSVNFALFFVLTVRSSAGSAAGRFR